MTGGAPAVHAYWFNSARAALEALPMVVRMSVEALVDNVVTLAQVSGVSHMPSLLGCDESGRFELQTNGVKLLCHLDRFGTGTITVKRVVMDGFVPS